MLENKANSVRKVMNSESNSALTNLKKSAVRYMAGYVAITLLKRYRKPSARPEVQLKHKLFIAVLGRMSADNQPESIDSLEDYSRLWSELIDHGGLYHINDQYSIELLKAVISLRVTVRTHAFSRGWTMQFERRYQKGTRKSLHITCT